MIQNIGYNKIKILIECPELIASVRIGVLNILDLFDCCETKFLETRNIKAEHIAWADILVIVRGCESSTHDIVLAAKKAKRKIVYFLDDDLLDVPIYSKSSSYFNRDIFKKNIESILAHSDYLWCVNPLIGEKYGVYTNANVVTTKIPMKYQGRKNGNEYNDTFKVLYAGSTDHSHMIQMKITPVVQKLIQIYGKKIEFCFIGADPGLKGVAQVKYINFFDNYHEYKKFIIEENFDIGLAPSMPESFYRYKYYNKYLEYTSVGVAGIYSNLPPFTQIVENNLNGFLCEDNEQSWFDTIKKCFSDRTLLISIQKNAIRKLEEQFSDDIVKQEVEKKIPIFCNYTAPFVAEKNIKLRNLKLRFIKERMKFIMQDYGIYGVLIIIYKIFKKMAVYLKDNILRSNDD